MKVLILGAHGMLGPWVVKALQEHYDLRLTDIVDIETKHESMRVDVANFDQVIAAAEGTDIIVNCSVLRPHPKIAFDVNTLGTYNAVRAAVELKMARFVNTGPHFTVTGSFYHEFDFGIPEEVPAHSGSGNVYAVSKSAGQEICRLFAANHSIHVLCMLFLNFRSHVVTPEQRGSDLNPFTVSWRDAGEAIKLALEVDLSTLPSQNESFFVTSDLPHGKYSNKKTKRLLGFEPQDNLEQYWRKP